MKRNQISLLLSSLVLSTTIIVGCNSGASSNGSTSSPETITTARQVPISISPMAAIPLTGVGHQFTLRISNGSSADYTLNSIEVIDPLTGKNANDKIIVNSALCEKIAKNSYCAIKITPQKVDSSAAFIIRAHVSSNGKQETISQLIRISDKIKAHNGIYYNNDIGEVVANSKSKYTLALPVVLDDSFSDMKVTNGLLDCEGKSKGSSCTYILNGSISGDKTLVATNIEGTHKQSGRKEQLLKSDTLVRTNMDYTKVVLSQPADIKADENGNHKPTTIFAYNLGNVPATDVAVTASTGFVPDVSKCTAGITGGDACTITANVDNAGNQVSVSGSLVLKYSGADKKDEEVSTQLFYDATHLDVDLELEPEGNSSDFKDVLVGTSKTLIYTLKNTGKKTLTDITVGLDDNVGFSYSASSCPTSLESGKECKIEVTYTPPASTNGQSSNTALMVTAKYNAVEGENTVEKTIYAETPISYSSLAVFTQFNVNPRLHSFAAPIGGTDIRSYTITNVSNYASSLAPAAIVGSHSLDPNEFTFDDGCKTLDPTKSCVIAATFAPTQNHTIKDMKINVLATGLNGVSATENIELIAHLNSSNATANAEPNISVRGPIIGQTEGSNNSPDFAEITNAGTYPTEIKFGMFEGRSVVLEYIFENAANAGIANNFNVAVGGMPSVFELEKDGATTNCPVGDKTGVLNPGSECSVWIQIPKEKYFAAGMLNGTTLVEGLSLPYSYENLDKKSYEDKVTDPVTITVSNEVADKLTLKAEAKRANDKIDVELEVTHAGLNPLVSKTDTDVVVTATIKGMPAQSLPACTAGISTKTCTVLELPASFPKGEHSLDVTIHPLGNDKLKQHKVVKFEVK